MTPRERIARALFIRETACDDPATAERLWRNLTSRMAETEWHLDADAVLSALMSDEAVQDAALVEARRRLDTRWTADPHPDLNLPEGEGRAYIYGFGRGAEWALRAYMTGGGGRG